MKNVTVTLPVDVAAWVRVRAAENGRSVSGRLADLLEGMRRGEDEYDLAMERYLARKPRKTPVVGLTCVIALARVLAGEVFSRLCCARCSIRLAAYAEMGGCLPDVCQLFFIRRKKVR